MVDHSHQSVLELRPQLDDKLVGRLDGEGRRDEADMQRPAEGHEHVDGLPVVQANDGVHAFGELGANWERKRIKAGREEKVSLWNKGLPGIVNPNENVSRIEREEFILLDEYNVHQMTPTSYGVFQLLYSTFNQVPLASSYEEDKYSELQLKGLHNYLIRRSSPASPTRKFALD